MKTIFAAAAFAALGLLPANAADAPAHPADYAVIVLTADANRSADAAWARIGDFCGIGKFLDIMSCAVTAGSGDLGTTRLINGHVVEVMVAKTARSYTYSQPTSAIFYHGTLAVEPVDAGHSKIVYTLFYDQAPLVTPEAQAKDRTTRSTRFQAAVDKMKAAVDAP